MRAILVETRGRADERRDIDPGSPAPGKVRVKVRYAGVGFADAMAVRGGYPLAPRRPFIPGYEFPGEIEVSDTGSASGDGRPNGGLAPGARVAGVLPRMGAYREYVDIDPRLLAPVPDGLGDEAAAAVPLNYLTALAMIERSAGLSRGDSFLIHGAAGGVGSAALDLARLLGLKAYGSASEAKRAVVASLGGIALRREGGAWLEELRKLAPGGVAAAFDAFGPASFRMTWKALSDRGRLVCYGIASAARGGYPEFLAGLAYLGSRALAGRGRGVRILSLPRIAARDPAWCGAALWRILSSAASGALSPLVYATYPWYRASEALDVLASGSVRGKLLLDFAV